MSPLVHSSEFGLGPGSYVEGEGFRGRVKSELGLGRVGVYRRRTSLISGRFGSLWGVREDYHYPGSFGCISMVLLLKIFGVWAGIDSKPKLGPFALLGYSASWGDSTEGRFRSSLSFWPCG